jgi:hypothetical protein
MLAVDEDLRDRHSATCPADHFLLLLTAEIDKDFVELDTFVLEQHFCPDAVGAG